ncbi:DNA-directed RNA polymerase III subunit RPC8 isoform X2 [Condylostylus longicornis]|uniref:DNA-directed RNA polymerase III subunit RPC8 isoform X2 n=1 Tax=Condylostylus longicornis TaxID=2530218 RepID=UPI00244D99AF|nr:DNA-directed RNA polymerase III subunit RPC8 isoform X2 [Condylostylus longicornis]
MFVLVKLRDTVRIVPGQFRFKLEESLRDEMNRKLANKVLLNVGLCVTFESLLQLNNSIILPGDGSSHTEIIFRFIVFRPSIGDVLVGKIRSCNREGVYVTLGFFDDVFVPSAALQHPSRYEETEQAWVWEYPLDSGEKHDLYMDIGESIKFRVSGEIFAENSPVYPQKIDPNQNVSKDGKTPYKIMKYRDFSDALAT